MPSSGSTRNRTAEPDLSLYLWLAGEDHPKACTGRRLVHRRIVREVMGQEAGIHRALLLDPVVGDPLGPYDAAYARRHGLLGVDCSWNRLSSRGGYPSEAAWLHRLRVRRRLPWLLAANPQHFGRIGELSTAEAFAASLWLLGDPAGARRILGPFAGGANFFEINKVRLDAYTESRSAGELAEAEARLG